MVCTLGNRGPVEGIEPLSRGRGRLKRKQPCGPRGESLTVDFGSRDLRFKSAFGSTQTCSQIFIRLVVAVF